LYFFASPGTALTLSVPALAARFEKRKIASPYFTKHHFSLLLPPDRVEYTLKKLETSAWKRLNTDKKPVAYFLNMILWLIYAGEAGAKPFLSRFVGFGPLMFIVPVILAAAARVLYLRLRPGRPGQERFHLVAAILVAGFAGMALEIVVLLAFQSAFGYLYYKIGFLIALFMLGLAFGGAAANRLRTGPRRDRLFKGCILCIALFSLLLPLWVRLAEILTRVEALQGGPGLLLMEVPFDLAVIVSGFLTGFAFPLANRLYISSGASGLRSASVMDSADHLGAAAGAFLTGVFLLPILGLDQTCIFLCVLALAAFSLLFFQIGKAGGDLVDTTSDSDIIGTGNG
jgi:hypothetical protein